MTNSKNYGTAVKYYDNFHSHVWPWGDLFFSRYQTEPICFKYLDRLEKHYDVLAFDSGVVTVSEQEVRTIVNWVKNGGTLITTPAAAAWSDEMIRESPTVPGKDWEQPLSHPNYLLEQLGIPLPENGKWGTELIGKFTAETCSKEYFPILGELCFKNAYSPIQDQINIDDVSSEGKTAEKRIQRLSFSE